jgi:branched-chain amino acid aminotransferase
MVIWLNGTFVDPEGAGLSPLDAGLQHGVGLFETMHARGGQVFRLHDHLERLRRSAQLLELMDSLRIDPLAEAVRAVVQRWGHGDARVRLTLTGGVINMLRTARDPAPVRIEPTLLIVATPATPFPAEIFERGVGVTVADQRLSSTDRFVPHKTLAYWPRLSELRRAARLGASESLWFDSAGGLACGCTSNAFIVRAGQLMTPPSGDEGQSPVLPGIARRTIIELALARGWPVRRQPLVVDDVLRADEMFLTNSAWGVLPVVRVEGTTIGGGAPGEWTRILRQGWLSRIADVEG